MRAKAAKFTSKNITINWRSHEPSRIETFSDAVFAFAVTLIIVSLEVPESFDELLETMKGFLSFAICFAAIFNIWNTQNLFFRRYGLTDTYTLVLNALLLFVVLMYAYPLKFLFVLLFSHGTYELNGQEMPMIHRDQIQSLMLIYGGGFMAINALFYLMYQNAQKHAQQLQLTAEELYETKTVTYINLICVMISVLAFLVALIFPGKAGSSGFIYCLIPVAYSTWFAYRGKKKRSLFKTTA